MHAREGLRNNLRLFQSSYARPKRTKEAMIVSKVLFEVYTRARKDEFPNKYAHTRARGFWHQTKQYARIQKEAVRNHPDRQLCLTIQRNRQTANQRYTKNRITCKSCRILRAVEPLKRGCFFTTYTPSCTLK